MPVFPIKLKAFSLVELAIALVIIGVLIGAVLKGQDLLESARLNSLIGQLNQYRLATSTFVDRYGALPGDYDKASTYIKAGLKDGNNNGRIEGEEAQAFWSHLAAAQMIPDPGVGKTPTTRLGSQITVQYTPLPELSGHWFVIGAEAPLTPLQALSLAKKMDSDDPLSGSVQVRNVSTTDGSNQCLKGPLFNVANKRPACVLYVQF
jgi:prepilin-type N-terminal cleavage/methylation domain-containing protein